MIVLFTFIQLIILARRKIDDRDKNEFTALLHAGQINWLFK